MARLARRTGHLTTSPVREILKIIDQPGMISFAGGLPAAETFPDFDGALPRDILQYGHSEGEPQLRNTVSDMLAARGLACAPEQVLILSGSQQGIDLVAKLMVEDHTPIAVEYPTYLAALQVFEIFGAEFTDIEQLDERVSLAYVNPTFQNPTGHCYTLAERQALARRCDAADIMLFEDDPYHDLVYDDCCRKPVCSLIESASWVYQGSFSKSLAPGLRLGYLAASPDLMPHLTILKQAADLHSNRVSQHLVLECLAREDPQQRLARLQTVYRRRRDDFNRLLGQYFGDLARWQVPPGGLFFWLELNPARNVDTQALLHSAVAEGVAFLPGRHFYPGDGRGQSALRLNFSHAGTALAEQGLQRLSALVRSQSTARSVAAGGA